MCFWLLGLLRACARCCCLTKPAVCVVRTRSRNLLTPIIIHGVWNSAVLTLLFALSASGVDVEQALSELR